MRSLAPATLGSCHLGLNSFPVHSNHFVADGQGVAIDLRSALSVLIASNVIEGNGPDAVRIYGSARQMESAIVASNLFRGAFGRRWTLAGS